MYVLVCVRGCLYLCLRVCIESMRYFQEGVGHWSIIFSAASNSMSELSSSLETIEGIRQSKTNMLFIPNDSVGQDIDSFYLLTFRFPSNGSLKKA